MAQVGSPRGAVVTATAAATDGRAFAIGTIWNDEASKRVMMQVSSASTITQYETVWVDENYTATSITDALATTAGRPAFAQVAMAAGDNAPVVLSGPITIKVLGSCAKAVPLYTTNTAGSLDDATNSGSSYQIAGVQITTTINGTTASTQSAIAGNVFVRKPQA